MIDVKFKTAVMAPSKGEFGEILKKQFDWRNGLKYTGESEIVFADIKENVWWNRPLNSDVFVKQEEDGLWSYNLPLAWRQESVAWKANYNVLLNKDNLPVAGMIKINRHWTVDDFTKLKRLLIDGVYNALLKLGVSKDKLQQPGNDILYDGKKFFGVETIIKDGWFSINCFITLKYKPAKEVFDRLSGHFVKYKSITGIMEETELFTKEEFIEALTKELRSILATIE